MNQIEVNLTSKFIKNCPFCGSLASIESTTFGDSRIINYRIRCIKNGHALDWWEDTIEDAIQVWNARV